MDDDVLVWERWVGGAIFGILKRSARFCFSRIAGAVAKKFLEWGRLADRMFFKVVPWDVILMDYDEGV